MTEERELRGAPGPGAPDGALVEDGAIAGSGAAADLEERARLERNAMALAFDDVRAQSADGKLSDSGRWREIGIIPAHLSEEDFEMMMYDYWEHHAAHASGASAPGGALASGVASGGAPAPAASAPSAAGGPSASTALGRIPRRTSCRSATRPVGVPPLKRREADATRIEGQGGSCEAASDRDGRAVPDDPSLDGRAPRTPSSATCAREDAAASSSAKDAASGRCGAENLDDDPFAGLRLPEGYALEEIEGEWVLVPCDDQAPPVELPIRCEGIKALVGARSYYLYDAAVMTDAFAHWAFLAAEDDPVVTFVECVREDSRVYPRPMPLQSLRNDPFRMSVEQIERAWEQAASSGEYPDIERVTASNGDVYFFSTTYLSAGYAASLAEWDAVERYLNV